ncbi:MAG: transglutaminase-like domain-containing protein [Candidatus Saccharicenans sp.]
MKEIKTEKRFLAVIGLALVGLLVLAFGGARLIPHPLFSNHLLENGRQNLIEEKIPEVRWYVVKLGQQKIGYLKETVEKVRENDHWDIKSRSEAKMVFNRLGKKAELIFNSEYVESEAGHLIKVISDQVLSSQPIRIEASIEKNRVLIKSTVGGRSFSRELPYTGELLGPEGIGQLTLKNLKKPGDKIEFKTLLAELSQVASGERTMANQEEIEFQGKKLKTKKIEENYSNLAYSRQVWLDEEGNEIRSVEPSPFGDMVTELSNEQEALSGLEGINLGTDKYQLSLIKANVRLPQARDLERVVIRLEHNQKEAGWPEIENDYQRILQKDNKNLIVELKRVELGKSSPPKEKISPAELASYLKANAYIDPDNSEIKKIAQQVAGTEKDNFKKALKLRDWVSRNMTFDLGIVFAPASEIIKNKRGTCAGYAALLASLLRASGLPSRYIIGLVYANGIWGGHAWVEAYINERWVPFDAAVPSPQVADPARLAIAWSSLNDGLGELLTAAQKIFGQVEIKILEYSFKGKNFKVEAGCPIYQIANQVYHNLGLQLSLKALPDFTFADLDRVWPDKTLLSLKGPAGETITLTQQSWFPAQDFEAYLISLIKNEVKVGKLEYWKAWGKKRPVLVSPEKSAIVLANGVDIFVLTAQGKESPGRLKMVLKNLKNELLVP